MKDNNRRDFIKQSGLLLGSLFMGGSVMSGTKYLYGGAEPYLGEICLFALNFAPRGWAFCDGALLSIQQNTALFSLLGTRYGGNGVTTFNLPNLQGRTPMHLEREYTEGLAGGSETHTLTTNEMPIHNHGGNLQLQQQVAMLATSSSPVGNVPASNPNYANRFSEVADETMDIEVNPSSAFTGGGQPHENRQPFLALNFCIALQGIYPSRP